LFYTVTNNLLGITSSGKSYTIGVCFLPGQNEADIVWGLREFQKQGIKPGVVVTDADDATINAVEQVFLGVPIILCLWHINQCVKKHYMEVVGYDKDGWAEFKAAWRYVLQSPTIADFNERWGEFCIKHQAGRTQGVVQYIRKEWIPKKERLVTAWTSKHRHYGTLVTSR
jgi:hypothetical protein